MDEKETKLPDEISDAALEGAAGGVQFFTETEWGALPPLQKLRCQRVYRKGQFYYVYTPLSEKK